MEEGLTHLNTAGEVHMVDVGDRRPTKREATASGCLQMQPTTLELIRSGNTPKGDLLAVARVAAIQAAKRTWERFPFATRYHSVAWKSRLNRIPHYRASSCAAGAAQQTARVWRWKR